jgi:hypothetical protein
MNGLVPEAAVARGGPREEMCWGCRGLEVLLPKGTACHRAYWSS